MKRLRKTFFIVLLLLVSVCFNMQESFAETTIDCTPALKSGAINDKSQVKILQKELNTVMGCGLIVDGNFGSKTESCVKSFQASYKLTKDGKAGPSTCKKLDEVYKKTTNTKEEVNNEDLSGLTCSNTLELGSKGIQVEYLQKKLNKTMGCGLDVDGSFGSKTESCVKSFQTEYKLTIDGKVGKNTCKKLNEVYENPNNNKEEVDNEDLSGLTCSNTLERGSKGIQVEYLQKKLNKTMGCGLDVDGSFGEGTESCVKSFQTEYKLTIDGKVGKNTCKKLNEVYENPNNNKEEVDNADLSGLTCSNPLKRGSNGERVKILQKELNTVMGCGLDVDGSFGKGTESCVKSFQSKMKLEVDGSVGRQTCRRLNSEYNQIASKSNDYVISKKTTTIREKSSASSGKVANVTYGMAFKVYDKNGDWYKIKYNNKYAYIKSSDVIKNAIVLDISEQNLRLYKKGKLILDSLVVTGNRGDYNTDSTPTPTGIFHIEYMEKAKVPGSNDPKDRIRFSKYGVSYVDYLMPFFGNYAFHDADWRSAGELAAGNTYTTNGSHGCVNMLTEDAKFLYNNVSAGYAVYIVK